MHVLLTYQVCRTALPYRPAVQYYWKPTREDLVNIIWQMYKEDGLTKRDIEALLDRCAGLDTMTLSYIPFLT